MGGALCNFGIMGYTHYWSRDLGANPEAYRLLCRDARKLFTFCETLPWQLAGPHGTGSPDVTPDAIAFNGAEPADYETFRWPALAEPRDYLESLSFDFCKTGQRPYDCAVVAFLLLAKHHYGDAVTLSSDGDRLDLLPGVQLARKLFPAYGLTAAPFLAPATAGAGS